MFAAVADTHTVVWFLAKDKRLSAKAQSFMNQAAQNRQPVALSSISLIEIVYLVEKKKIPFQSFSLLIQELHTEAALFKEIPVDLSIVNALLKVSALHIPEMPDRIIAATAVHLNVPVISRDMRIQASGIPTLW
jgi:PIN domain nuclease of toxin-antitoxin system